MQGKSKKTALISFIIAIGLFMGLLFVESSILKPNGTINAFVAISDIEKGTLITEGNIDSIFKEATIDGGLEVTGAVKHKEELLNIIANENINKNEVISANKFIDKDDLLKDIENPVETSFNVSDISQVVGGILREGDLIDISVVDDNTNENIQVLKRVYITKAISSDGTEIDRSTDLSALTLNVIISERDESILNSHINSGTIRVSKVN